MVADPPAVALVVEAQPETSEDPTVLVALAAAAGVATRTPPVVTLVPTTVADMVTQPLPPTPGGRVFAGKYELTIPRNVHFNSPPTTCFCFFICLFYYYTHL